MASKYTRSYSKALFVLCLLVATCVQAQQFRTSIGSTMAENPQMVGGSTYSNPMLQPKGASSVSLPVAKAQWNSVNGQVYSKDLFMGKYNNASRGGGGGGSRGGGRR